MLRAKRRPEEIFLAHKSCLKETPVYAAKAGFLFSSTKLDLKRRVDLANQPIWVEFRSTRSWSDPHSAISNPNRIEFGSTQTQPNLVRLEFAKSEPDLNFNLQWNAWWKCRSIHFDPNPAQIWITYTEPNLIWVNRVNPFWPESKFGWSYSKIQVRTDQVNFPGLEPCI